MKKIVIVCLAFFSTLQLFSQEKIEEKKFGISISGYVKNDFFLDTRQVQAAREGHFLYWPLPEVLDASNEDINAKPNFNMLAVQSRLSGKITGPDAFGAKTSGLIESDFFAQADANINLLRLRHAYVKLNWATTEMLFGQTWNPLFVTGCYPGTVSFNTGTPLQSFARNPQIRISHNLGNIRIIYALLSQRDYSSRGDLGMSSVYLRNSAVPDAHFQLHYTTKNDEAGTSFLAGVGVSYKNIVPRLSSEVDSVTTYKVDEKVSSMATIAFAAIKLKPVTIKLQGRYGENMPDVLSISGFAVKDVVNATTGELSYTPLKSATFWGEFHTNGKDVQFGVFGGISKNLGTKEAMSAADNDVYGLKTNIETLYRVSPRIIFNSNKVRFALELEYTSASYGSGYDVNYIPSSTNTVSNLRALFATYYFF